MEKAPLVEFKDIYKIHKMGDEEVHALDGISFKIYQGEFVAIVGQSGSGKSTCMNIIGCLDVPTSGEYYLNGKNISKYSRNELAEVRNKMLGFIFQQYNLLPKLNVMNNVALPLLYAGLSKSEQKQKAMAALEKVGLSDKAKNKPSQLSGGQQQRVAIARTLALEPDIILFDEPMSALDADNRLILRKEIKNIQKKLKTTMIYITHDQEEAFSLSDRVMVMNNGVIEQIDTPNKIFNEPKNEYVKKFVTNHLIEKVSSIEKCTKVDL